MPSLPMLPMLPTLPLRATAALLVAALVALTPARLLAQATQDMTDVQVVGHILKPAAATPGADFLQQVQLPEGFQVNRFADGLGNARVIVVSPEGRVYVSRRKEGAMLLLEDTDGDGVADRRETVATQPDMHGLTLHSGPLYMVAIHEVWRAPIKADGTLGALKTLISDLPQAGQHPNRTLAVSPDGQLFISVGSTCNACSELKAGLAALYSAGLDGSQRQKHADGLRNTIGFGWHLQTGELWGLDHGIDWLGDQEQSEELNRIVQGRTYGWPYVYADGKFNRADAPPDTSHAAWAERAVEPVALYTPHAAPMQLVFYTGDSFPAEYRGDAFATMRGSWNRKPPSGYEVVRIHFDGAGQAERIEPFLTGFLTQDGPERWTHYGRLMGLAQMPDGSLLVGGDHNGILYRIHHGGRGQQHHRGPGRRP